MSVRLGYACISVVKHKENIYTGRTITLAKLAEVGIEEAKRLALANINDLALILEYNESIGIRFYRLTSNLFPHIGNPKAQSYTLDFATEALGRVGDIARGYGHRITMHPGQFAQLGSPKSAVVAQTIRDLTIHAKILLSMKLTPALGSVLIIHGGGSFGDKSATLLRWETTYRAIPLEIRQFIALENDDYQYTVMDLLPICERNNIPLCIDFFHHQCLGADKFDIYYPPLIARIMNTWRRRGIKPKCHWSNQAIDQRKGAHADYVEDIPPKLLNVCKEYDCDIMIEAKKKDLAALKLYEKYYDRVKVDNKRIEWHIRPS